MTLNEASAMRDDAASAVARQIEQRTFDSPEDDPDYICPDCRGSGEGHADGTICRTCGGEGGKPKCRKVDNPAYWDYQEDTADARRKGEI